MEKQTLTCIRCPIGCTMEVTLDGAKNVVDVEGCSCGRGKQYAAVEAVDPRRTITSTVRVVDSERPLVAVKTQSDVPKDRIFAVMAEIRKISVHVPIHIGDTIKENIAGTGIALVATENRLA